MKILDWIFHLSAIGALVLSFSSAFRGGFDDDARWKLCEVSEATAHSLAQYELQRRNIHAVVDGQEARCVGGDYHFRVIAKDEAYVLCVSKMGGFVRILQNKNQNKED